MNRFWGLARYRRLCSNLSSLPSVTINAQRLTMATNAEGHINETNGESINSWLGAGEAEFDLRSKCLEAACFLVLENLFFSENRKKKRI